jgi:hypothetical protein
MKRTTEAMHKGLSRAVIELRARMRWGQTDLAKEISRQGVRAKVTLTPDQGTISRWERCESAPSPQHRMVLARIASKNGHEDLAELFRAPISAWRLVGRLTTLAEHG